VRACDPDVIENHNLHGFDLPFLAERARRLGVTLELGRLPGVGLRRRAARRGSPTRRRTMRATTTRTTPCASCGPPSPNGSRGRSRRRTGPRSSPTPSSRRCSTASSTGPGRPSRPCSTRTTSRRSPRRRRRRSPASARIGPQPPRPGRRLDHNPPHAPLARPRGRPPRRRPRPRRPAASGRPAAFHLPRGAHRDALLHPGGRDRPRSAPRRNASACDDNGAPLPSTTGPESRRQNHLAGQ
jgi:hypothetical protein